LHTNERLKLCSKLTW